MSLDAEHTRLTKLGTVTIFSEGEIRIVVDGFEAENATCRDVAVLATTWAIGELSRSLMADIERPGGGVSGVGTSAAPCVDEETKGMWVPYPSNLHHETAQLVAKLAFRLAIKLRKAERKYGFTDGWRDDTWMDRCQAELSAHVAKGDPLDVAAYCAFCLHHGWSTAANGDPR
jgi:hypothetical protein